MGMGPSGAWITEDDMKLHKYIAWTGVFAYDTVAYRHGKLAYLKHEFQRFPLHQSMFLLRTIQLLIGTGLSGAWILKYEIQIYHVDQSFSYDTVAYGHGELVYLKHKF